MDPSERSFLFLQGPHGPFFDTLGSSLRAAGAATWRVAFNAGDVSFWSDTQTLLTFRQSLQAWPNEVERLIDRHRVTDLVLYGDTRPIHTHARATASARNLTCHVFEEGYLRPWWITYERGGSNGNSRLMDLQIEDMRRALEHSDLSLPEAPSHWGDMRHHIFYGALYHWHVLFRNKRFQNFQPHRGIPVADEFLLHLRRLASRPLHAAERAYATRRIRNGGFPYHLCLLQLAHDSSFTAHGPFNLMRDFLTEVIEGFRRGAPRHHHLVFKSHPLEDNRTPLRTDLRRVAQAAGVSDRVHFVPGGKLAALLDHARSAVTVNSTAAQQALWRSLPVKAFGSAVYAKPELVSAQPLAEFFARPRRPDCHAYRTFRAYMLETCQIAGGFYSSRGRNRVLRQVVDMMLAPEDPYDALSTGNAPPRHHLRSVL